MITLQKKKLDFESVVSDILSTTATSAVQIPAKELAVQTVGGDDTYDVIPASPSGSSDGSSNEFVKVEHSDVQKRLFNHF